MVSISFVSCNEARYPHRSTRNSPITSPSKPSPIVLVPQKQLPLLSVIHLFARCKVSELDVVVRKPDKFKGSHLQIARLQKRFSRWLSSLALCQNLVTSHLPRDLTDVSGRIFPNKSKIYHHIYSIAHIPYIDIQILAVCRMFVKRS